MKSFIYETYQKQIGKPGQANMGKWKDMIDLVDIQYEDDCELMEKVFESSVCDTQGFKMYARDKLEKMKKAEEERLKKEKEAEEKI